MKVKIAKWGNSLGLRLPKAAAEAAGIDVGAELDLVVEGCDLRLKRTAKIPYYRLEDLLTEMDRLGPKNRPEFIDWGPDVGAEIIDDDYSRGLITCSKREIWWGWTCDRRAAESRAASAPPSCSQTVSFIGETTPR